VEMTQGCYGSGDSQGFAGCSDPWDTHYQFSIKTLLSKEAWCGSCMGTAHVGVSCTLPLFKRSGARRQSDSAVRHSGYLCVGRQFPATIYHSQTPENRFFSMKVRRHTTISLGGGDSEV